MSKKEMTIECAIENEWMVVRAGRTGDVSTNRYTVHKFNVWMNGLLVKLLVTISVRIYLISSRSEARERENVIKIEDSFQ